MPVVRKHVLSPGVYFTRRGPVEFTAQDIRTFYETGKAMLAAGVPSPVPLEHQATAKPKTAAERAADSVAHNTGWTTGYHLEGDALYADLDVRWLPEAKTDEEILHRLENTVKWVSPEILPHFRDGAGNEWRNLISHVALTTVPVFGKQQPFGAGPSMLSLHGDDIASAPWSANKEGMRLSMADLWYTHPAYASSLAWADLDDAADVSLGVGNAEKMIEFLEDDSHASDILMSLSSEGATGDDVRVAVKEAIGILKVLSGRAV